MYIHEYDALENVRLTDQASTLVELLHADTRYEPGSAVLEAGCGVGGQTAILARNSPGAAITSIDISASSVAHAGRTVAAHGLTNVALRQRTFSIFRSHRRHSITSLCASCSSMSNVPVKR